MPDTEDTARENALLRAELAAARAELTGAKLFIAQLEAQLAVLRRMQFGRSSEKLVAEIAKPELLLEDLEEGEAAKIAAPPAPVSRAASERQHPVRRPLPEHLPREEVVHHPGNACPCCGGTRLSKLGEDVTEVLERVPARLKVIRQIGPRSSCRAARRSSRQPHPDCPSIRGVERGITGQSAERRLAVRRERSVPLLAELRLWMEAERRRLSSKTALAKALQYALTHWDALARFAGDGRLGIDNNPAERAARAASPLPGKVSSSSDRIRAANALRSAIPRSKPRASTASIPNAGSPTSSTALRAVTASSISTSSCPGTGNVPTHSRSPRRSADAYFWNSHSPPPTSAGARLGHVEAVGFAFHFVERGRTKGVLAAHFVD